jgi:hypothetical protein
VDAQGRQRSQHLVRTAAPNEPFHDQVCILSQRWAEKYLRGLLAELGLNIPRTHNLDDLLALLLYFASALHAPYACRSAGCAALVAPLSPHLAGSRIPLRSLGVWLPGHTKREQFPT